MTDAIVVNRLALVAFDVGVTVERVRAGRSRDRKDG
jgi:hypothetical protein